MYYSKVEPVQTSVEETDTEDSLALSRAEYFTDGTRVPNHLLIPEFRPIILQSAPEHLGLVIRGVMYNSFEALERLGGWNYNVNPYTEK